MEQLLQQYFGYNSFRPLQKEIITDTLNKHDVLAVMPTGSGKSICFQIPALLHPDKTTIVVSPLIALMKDQVDGLKQNGVRAAFLNSSLSSAEQEGVKQLVVAKQLSLLYLAPERLAQSGFLEFLKKIDIHLFAIDEAHCISEWGHDFRPEYRELKKLRELFPTVPILALTATATTQVKIDIEKQLALKGVKKYQASFDRPNLIYSVLQKNRSSEQIVDCIKKHTGESGIIYCQSRKDVDALAEYLQKNTIKALPYHAGLASDMRQKHQEMFIKEDVDIIVATIAFGMGIDKSNVRFVIHADLPKSVEGYYQETGRAGRDGLPSECILLYSYADKRKSEYFILQKEGKQKEIAYKQLDDMIQFAKSVHCRRIALLKYFDEVYTTPNCKACDNCLTPKEMFDATIVAQKILSCVYRVEERFGMRHIMAILTGSTSERIMNLGHNTLSTYDIVKDYNEQQLQTIIIALIDAGFLQIGGTQYPIVQLTDKSVGVLKQKTKVLLPKLQEKPLRRKKQKLFASNVDQDLFETLRMLRKKLADQQGVPPYVVFPDVSLHEMATFLPKNKTDFKKITGVGERKVQSYGEIFIEAIKEYGNIHTIQQKGDTVHETVRLLRQGLSIEQIAQQRNLATSTIGEHLSKAYIKGEDIDIAQFLPHEKQEKIKGVFQKLGYEKLAPAKEALGDEYSYNELRFVQAMMIKEHGTPPGWK